MGMKSDEVETDLNSLIHARLQGHKIRRADNLASDPAAVLLFRPPREVPPRIDWPPVLTSRVNFLPCVLATHRPPIPTA